MYSLTEYRLVSSNPVVRVSTRNYFFFSNNFFSETKKMTKRFQINTKSYESHFRFARQATQLIPKLKVVDYFNVVAFRKKSNE